MDAIELLMGEHRMIERVLDGLVGFTAEVQRKGSTDKDELGRFVRFARDFADAGHHGKEEDILFAAMVENGFPRNGGPIAVMLHEHDQGRGLVKILRERAEQAAPWTDADRQEIAAVADGYARMLRDHIHKEDAILYPMAEQHLSGDALAEVGAACERHQRDRAGQHEALHALADELIRQHAAAVHPEPTDSPRGFGCCG